MRPEFYPKVDKAKLFADRYIMARSGHSRGSTLDLTLVAPPAAAQPAWRPGDPLVDGGAPHHVRFADNGIDMGTGFVNLATEWWHYTLADKPFPSTYFDFEVQ